ncbi:MAG: 3-methyl-2-oxobutanoate hydroxymethyltransferase [candidate division Zixibacteria bacterium]|jgi:3-methyl-2-oxobutanoate hydroxymethyltransferase|nr:3-methyl-2-oxobutanoate hydroxymethyltransferase [candidate division Zixibacteria bacterium]
MPDSYSNEPKKINVKTLRKFKKEGRKIAVLTAYDFPTAKLLDNAGVDCLLVGDSAATVVYGYPNTLPITMDQMILLCQAVSRGVKRALLIGDMPFLSYQPSEEIAIINAGRFLKEGGVEAVKLEGGLEMVGLIRKMVDFGIPVMGHIGLTPQSVNKFGGYKIMGKTDRQREYLLKSAEAMEGAGAFAIVLESVVPEVARKISESIKIPTIGIGAGTDCDGQVLVVSDMIGLFEEFRPKFVRQYAQLAKIIRDAAGRYCDDVRSGKFPGPEESYEG